MQVFASSEAQQKAFIDSAGLSLMTKDDLAEDFGDLVTAMELKNKKQHFSSEQLEIISNINQYLHQKSIDHDLDFWRMDTRSCIEGWEEVRAMAMAMDYLAIEHAEEIDIFDFSHD